MDGDHKGPPTSTRPGGVLRAGAGIAKVQARLDRQLLGAGAQARDPGGFGIDDAVHVLEAQADFTQAGAFRRRLGQQHAVEESFPPGCGLSHAQSLQHVQIRVTFSFRKGERKEVIQMLASIPKLAALVVCCQIAFAGAADAEKEMPRTAQDERACAGVSNENTKMRELRRELGAYFGQSIPEDLQQRVRKHIDLVAKLKAECERQREQAALAR